jgi:hypothetical protein
MKRALMIVSIAAVFSLALFANAYASEMFNYYGADFRGGPVTGNSQVQNWDEGQQFRPWLAPGSTTPSSGGFGYYGAGPFTEVENPQSEMQTHYGQAPSSTEEQGQPDLRFLRPGSTTPASGGFGSY